MSIIALKRKTKHIQYPISGKGKNGFSLCGGYRNQGRVGQPLAGRSLGGTKFKGNTPIGNGGCCGKYTVNVSKTGSCCTNDPSIIKRSSMTTQGRIQSGLIHPVGGLYRNVECNKACRKIWVADLSSLNQSQSIYIHNKSVAAAGRVTRKPDAGKDSCTKHCKAGSYYIGTKKHVRKPYAKDLNAFPVSQGQYMNSILFNKHNLPTPPCKKAFPPNVNNQGCGTHVTTIADAVARGIMPPNHDTSCGCDCKKSGLPHKQPTISQNIPINTSVSSYSTEQLSKLKGQKIY